MKTVLIAIASVLIALIVFFSVARWATRRYYRPSPSQIRALIKATMDETITDNERDEFEQVPIAYDPWLDSLRTRTGEVVFAAQEALRRGGSSDEFYAALRSGLEPLIAEIDSKLSAQPLGSPHVR